MAASEHAHISTPRLRLVPVTEGDPEAVVAGIGNYEVARWLGRVPYPYGLEDAKAFINANRDLAGRVWFILDSEGLVGGISIDREFGYWLGRDAWGQGYATEAGEAVIDVHFSDPSASVLVSGHYPGNDRSARVLKKLGFRYTGRRPVRSAALAQTIQSQEMKLSRDDWDARHRIEIRTGRLHLRPLAEGDWRRLQQIGGVPEVARMTMSLTAPWPEAAVRHWIRAGRFRGRPGYRLGVTIEGGMLIGVAGLGPDRSLALMIDRRFWGRGYATEAAEALVSDAFRRFPEVEEILADRFVDNPASDRVLTKLGFDRIGSGLGASKARVERAPIVLYRLRRDRLGDVS